MIPNGSDHDWLALIVLVFTLGLRHGLDADHIVAIDGLTRFNATHRPRLARLCGFLFSLGHGVAVMGIALGVAALGNAWHVPGWVEDFGVWVSILMLAALGVVNLLAVVQTPKGVPMQLVALKGRFLVGPQHTGNPAAVVLIGAAFAVSFDTVSQAVMFAVLGVKHGGWENSVVLGALFAAGMILVDACNGLWMFRMIACANSTALMASRVFGVIVGALSLIVAGFGLSKYLSPQLSAWSDGKELAIGLGLIAVVAIGFVVAISLAKRTEPRPVDAS